jgi:putative NADPH-quinone reductase
VNVLVLLAHPLADSYGQAIFDQVMSSLEVDGHDVRAHDLWHERFDPVLSAVEKRDHFAAPEKKTANDALLATHVADLQWCEAIVFVYPSWWSAPPAIMKGWFDRVLMQGVAWTFPDGATRLYAGLTHVRRLVCVTTYGSSRWVNALEGEPGKATIRRGLRVLCNRRCRSTWIAHYGVDRASHEVCSQFLAKLPRRLHRALR